MRLIDADDFKRFMQALCKAGAPYESVVELLDKQPTAYDIDKVVEELDSLRITGNSLKFDLIPYNKAIEIVKQGVVSEAEQKLKEMESE